MALNTVTLEWDLTDLIQSGLAATLSITPTAQLSDTTDHILIPPVARTYTFTGGRGSLAGIVANDNAHILPAGSGYLISVTAVSGQVIVPQFQTQIDYANGATQWLDALAVVPVVATSYQYLPLPSGTPGAGQVPVATGSGQASAWGSGAGAVASVFGRTGVIVATTGDYTAAQVGALATANNLSDLGSPSTARANLGLGSAAVQNTSAFDAAGAAASALASAEAYALPVAGGAMAGELAPKVVTLTDAPTVSVNASQGNDFRLLTTSAVGATRAIGAPSGATDGQVIRFAVQQAASGGPYSATWASGAAGYDFGSGSAPTLSSTASAIDVVGFFYHAGKGQWLFMGSQAGF